MKKILIGALVLVLLITSCATAYQEPDLDALNADGSPVWTKDVPESRNYIYGVGESKLTSRSNSKQQSAQKARAMIAKSLSVTVQEATTAYVNEAGGQVIDAFESISVQTVNVSMKGVTIVRTWTAEDGTVWSLAAFPVKDMVNNFSVAAADYLDNIRKEQRDIMAMREKEMADIKALKALVEIEAPEAEELVNAKLESFGIPVEEPAAPAPEPMPEPQAVPEVKEAPAPAPAVEKAETKPVAKAEPAPAVEKKAEPAVPRAPEVKAAEQKENLARLEGAINSYADDKLAKIQSDLDSVDSKQCEDIMARILKKRGYNV